MDRLQSPLKTCRAAILCRWSLKISSANKAEASFQPVGIEYKVEGASSQFTTIDNGGILRCGLDETAEILKVTAQATYIDPAHPEIDQTVSAALSVPVVGQWLGGWKVGAIESIEIQGEKTVKNGEHIALKAIATKTDGNKADVTNLALWTVDQHATITPNGVLTGTAAGAANVTAKFAGATGTAQVTVTA